jgi:hypothetical protein
MLAQHSARVYNYCKGIYTYHRYSDYVDYRDDSYYTHGAAPSAAAEKDILGVKDKKNAQRKMAMRAMNNG